MRTIVARMTVASAMAAFAVTLAGCHGIPKGTTKDAMAGGVKIQATGAGIIKADAQKTTFKIKCVMCGYETAEITVDTPATGKPYVQEWICPECGHKQKIVIQLAAQ